MITLEMIGYVLVWGHDKVFKSKTSLNGIEDGPFSLTAVKCPVISCNQGLNSKRQDGDSQITL